MIRIYGKDAKSFLQRLISNDIELTEVGPIYSTVLNHQGRFLFDFFVAKSCESDYWILSVTSSLKDLINHFNAYKLRSDVSLVLSENVLHTYTYHKVPNSLISFADPRYHGLGYHNIRTKSAYDIDTPIISSEEYLVDKYKFCIPDGGIDLICGSSFPSEYGLDFLNGISYTKGCYVGQESVNRIKNFGVIRKKIFHVSVGNSNEERIMKRDIIVGGLASVKIGFVCSYNNCSGIAILNEMKLKENESRYTLEQNGDFNLLCEDGILYHFKTPIWRL